MHPGALGDVLQAIPALRTLGRRARITFAGQPRLARLLADTGVVERALAFDTLGLEALFSPEPLPAAVRERLSRFDLLVSWFGSRDETYAQRLRTLAAACVVASPVGAESGGPVWRHLCHTIESGDITARELERLAVPDAWRRVARTHLGDLGVDPNRRLLLIHPGAGGAAKLWPAERFAQVIRHALTGTDDVELLVHQGPADREVVERLLPRLDARVLRLVEPELSLLAGILADAAAYLGVDSGVSQLAAATGCRATILYPAGTFERWTPWSSTALALRADSPTERIAIAVSERLRHRAPWPSTTRGRVE